MNADVHQRKYIQSRWHLWCQARIFILSIHSLYFLQWLTDSELLLIKVHKWEKQRTERENSLSQVPKLISDSLNGEFINSASLLCASTCWLWSSEGGCDAWAEGMCMLWWVECHPFPHSFAGAAPQHVLCHYRIITDVILHNEVRSEKSVLLIVMTSIFIKMRNLESNNAQRIICGNWSHTETARQWAESRRESYTIPF